MKTYLKVKLWAGNSAIVLLMLALTACGSDTSETESDNGVTQTSYLIGGEVLGLEGDEQVEVKNNSEVLSLAVNGPFNFVEKQIENTSYNVTVTASPSGKTCQLENRAGIVSDADITNIVINCSIVDSNVDSFNVGGTLTGLESGTVTLANKGQDIMEVNSNGSFTFSQKLTTGSSYNVTVIGQPGGLSCEVENGLGTIADFAISNIVIICQVVAVENSFVTGGILTGLESGLVSLANNGHDILALNSNGAFSFSQKLTTGSAYNVTVISQPEDQVCEVENGLGTMADFAINNIIVSCQMIAVEDRFAISGTLTGVDSGTVILANNGHDNIALNSNGSFSFSQTLTTGNSFNVTVISQPDGLRCEVENGLGTIADTAIDNIIVSCQIVVVENSFNVGGILTGLASGLVTLSNNGVDFLELNADGEFVFNEKILIGNPYQVTLSSQPEGYNCEVQNGLGIVENAAISNISVNCIAVGVGHKFIRVNNQYNNNSVIGSIFKVVSTTDNSPVLGLNSSDLILHEDNIELPLGDAFSELKTLDDVPLTLKTLFMVDISASTTDSDIEDIKQWLKDIVFDISKGTHNLLDDQTIAITTFDSSIINRTGFTSDVDQLLTAIEGIRKGGPLTNLYGAMLDGLANWTDSETPNYINHGAMVLLTANDDSRGLGTLEQVQQAALTKDVFIIPVGAHVNQEIFSTVVPENRIFPITNHTQLANAFEQFEDSIENAADGFYQHSYVTSARTANHSFNLSLIDNQYTGNGHNIEGVFSALEFSDVIPDVVIKQHDNAVSSGESLQLEVNTRWSHNAPNYSWSVISGANLVTLSNNGRFANLLVEAGPDANTSFTIEVTDNENNVSKIESIAITPLKTPQDISVTASYQQVELSWGAVENASHYLVYWSEHDDINSASSFERIDNGEEAIIDGLQNAQEYYFSVTSVENYQQSKPSLALSATPFINQPAGLNVSTQSNVNTLEWEPVLGVVGYHLVITNLTTNAVQTVGIAAGDSQYIHTDISSGQIYSYSLMASDGSSDSQAAITTALSAPVINMLETASTSSMNISWQPVVGAESYVISYAEKTLAGTDIFAVAATVETNYFSLQSLVSGKQYVINVTAINDGAEAVSSESALLYQPTWSAGSDLPSARHSFSSNLMDGKIYLIGGFGAEKNMDVYDSALGQWNSAAALRNQRVNHTSSVINGKLYVVGGFGTERSLQIYNPTTDQWYAGASLSIGRNLHSATVIDGKLFVVGGDESGGAGASSSLEIYDPVNDSWSLGAQLSIGRTFHTSTQMDGKLYVVGGRVAGEYSNSVEIYDPTTDGWSQASELNMGRYQHTTTAIDGKLYVVGGFTDINFQNSLEIYDSASDSWTQGASLTAARYSHTSELVNNKLYVMAGRVDGINSQSVEIYDLATQSWSQGPSLATARDAHSSTAINGNIYILGGKDINDVGLPSLEVFDNSITPLNPTIETVGADINLSWPDISGVDEYHLYWNTTGAVTEEDDVITINGLNNYRHENLSRNINHYYRLSWVIEGEEIMLSNQVSSLVRIVAPSSLMVNVNGATNTLSWDSVAGATSYHLVITNLETNVQQNVEIPAGDASLEHTGFTVGQVFSYSLTASDREFTTEATSITSAAGLSIVSAESISSSSIDLRWSAVAGADLYTVSYAEKNLAGTDLYTEVTTTSATSYVFEGLVSGKQYVMKVIASGEGINAQGNMTTVLHLSGWSEVAPLTTARRTHTSDVFDDKIYVIGGYTTNLEIYDTLSNSWTQGSSAANSRSGHSTTNINNKFYVVGGWGADDSLKIYDPVTDSWSQGASLNNGRYFHTSSLINGKLYVVGGSGAEGSLEIYDPATDSWTEGASLALGRMFHTSSVIDNKLYIVAGRAGSSYVNSVEIYDPVNGTWEQAASLTTGRYAHTNTVFNGKLYVVGGNIAGGYTTSVEIYNSVNDSWSDGAPLNIERTSHTINELEGKLYAIAGSNRNGQINTVDVYDPQNNSWEMGESLLVPREGHTAHVVDGKFYAIAGKSGVSTLASMEIYDRNATPMMPSIKGVNGGTDLTWPAITGVSEYRLYWNEEGSVSDVDAMISIDAANNTYQHRNLLNGSAYYYRLSWVIEGEEIVLSNEISAIPTEL